jgi:uncharacterized DUF497 family protein
MAELSFEWDEDKNAANIKNHGIDFLDAALIFENPTLEAIDDRADYGEVRYIAFGLSGETVLQVVYNLARKKRHPHYQRMESKPK